MPFYIVKDSYVIVNKLKNFKDASTECRSIQTELATSLSVRDGKVEDQILDKTSKYKYYRIGLRFINGSGVWINNRNSYNEKVNGKLKALTSRSGYKDVVLSRDDDYLYLASPDKNYSFICEEVRTQLPTASPNNVMEPNNYHNTFFKPSMKSNTTIEHEISSGSLTWLYVSLLILFAAIIATIVIVKCYKRNDRKRDRTKENNTVDASMEFRACSVYNVAYVSIDQVVNNDIHTYETVSDVRNSNIRNSNASAIMVEEGSSAEGVWDRNKHSSFMKPKKKNSRNKKVGEDVYAVVDKSKK